MPLMILKRLFGGGKKRGWLKKIIILSVVGILMFLVFYFMFNILPLIIFSSSVATMQINEDVLFTEDNNYSSPTINGEGEAIVLSGGLEAMGVNFEATITDLQTQYAAASDDSTKKTIAGKIAYAQLIQILNAETEITSHPVLLLGSAMMIRERSIFSQKYEGFAKDKLQGDDLSLGIYGTWCNGYINGLTNNGGGVISHAVANVQAQYKSNSATMLAPVTFTDLTNGGSITVDINQSYGSLVHKGGSSAAGYNKGAYGPIQIEADHWITWVCPYIVSHEKYNSYIGQAYVNIPIDDKRFDGLQSAQSKALSGYARSIVTSANSHLKVYRQNQEFVDNIMATVGHPNYISEYANLVNNTSIGQERFGNGTGYYFAGRFTKGQDWEDWVMSLEAWPHAATCFVVDRLGSYLMFDNTGQIKNSAGEIIANGAWKAKLLESYGEQFTFVNKTAEDIYWSLEMMQSWNYGNVCRNYSSKTHLYNIAWFYRELANYIAINGTSAIRENAAINPKGSCTCGVGKTHSVSHYSGISSDSSGKCTAAAYETYCALTDFLCQANGTSDDIKTLIKDAFYKHQSMTHHKNNYAYAVTGLFDAEAYMQTVMRDIFGLEDFNIFNYGGGVGGGAAPSLDSYDYSQPVPASASVANNFFNDAIFVGDSLTVGLANNSDCNANFLAKTGATASSAMTDSPETLSTTNTIVDCIKSSSFDMAYIMYGINNVNSGTDAFKSSYVSLIKEIKTANPNAVIYVQSILPINSEGTYGSSISNETIMEKNNILRQIAQEEKCIYVNVREIFENEDGTYKAELWSSDGLHLADSAYSLWYSYLKTHTVTLKSNSTTEGSTIE